MFSTGELATTERCLYFSTVYSFHVAVPHQQSQVRDVVGPLVLGGNVLIQVSEVLAAVPAVVAGVGLLWLLCGGLQPEGQEGQWGGSWDTGGGLGSSCTGEGWEGWGADMSLPYADSSKLSYTTILS